VTEESGVLFGLGIVLVLIGVLIGTVIGRQVANDHLPTWIDKEERLVSWQGKPYRMVECEYIEKGEVKP